MKKILIALVILVFSSPLVFADTIGYLDMEKVIMNYKEAKKKQGELQVKREEFKAEVEKKQEELEKAKAENKNEEEIEEIKMKIEEELRPRQEEILRAEMEAQRGLITKIMDTAEQVSKEYGIDVVLDKRVVYTGGFDLTDFVLEKL